MYLAGDHGSVARTGQKRDAPVLRVLAADGFYLCVLLDIAVFISALGLERGLGWIRVFVDR